ncbi:acyl-CoA N-acyltransferase [Geopyxis carbonaria]|nr:acyl-CoA N-acyltransferase [Geopyxis carbonaria]
MDEDNDPASDYEDPLECAVCGMFSHRQCDRTANETGGVKSAFNEEATSWRCPNCAASGLDPGSRVPVVDSRAWRGRRGSPVSDKATRRLRKRNAEEEFDDDLPVSARRRKRPEKRKQPNGIGDDEEREAIEDDVIMNGHRKRRKIERNEPLATIIKTPHRIILKIKIPSSLSRSLSSPPKARATQTPSIMNRRRNTPQAPPQPSASHNIYPVIHEDNAQKPYGGILSEAEANTTETLPGQSERIRFDGARKAAEEEQRWRSQFTSSYRQADNRNRNRDKDSARVGEASLIECIHFGQHEIDTWYAAPYPEEYSLNKVLWICEYCLKYMNSEYVCWRHKMKCPAKHPPGDEIYRDGSISVFEIDGRKQPVYCQNLCLMAKLFLGSKTLYYDVHPFLFYVMTESDEFGMHFVGYFSKEKREGSQNNVSCILTLPIHQRKGYGNLLIDFSYLLTRVEKKTGSPEKPFSDLGLVSYRNYWKLKLCYELRNQTDPLTIEDLSNRTGMTTDDIICGLEVLRALVRDPQTGVYALRLDYSLFQAHIDRWEAKGYVKLNPAGLLWTPYLMGRSQAEHLNDMPLTTIAPRPGEHKESEADADQIAEASTNGSAVREDTPVTGKNIRALSNGNGDSASRANSVQAPDSTSLLNINDGMFQAHSPNPPDSPAVRLGKDLTPLPIKKLNFSSRPLETPRSGPRVSEIDIGEIPPSRFVIAPITPVVRKPGRPFGSTASAMRQRKRQSQSPVIIAATPRGSTPSTIARRGRTKLADTITVNGNSPSQSEASYGKGKGKGDLAIRGGKTFSNGQNIAPKQEHGSLVKPVGMMLTSEG